MSPDAERWDALLTDLEARVTSGTSAPWTPPSDLGPVPRAMLGRASRLVAAQRDAVIALEAQRQSVAQHLSALRTVEDSREPARSVYLDVTG